MRVAINTDLLTTGYRIQGTGIYTSNLIVNLKRDNPKNEYISFSRTKKLSKKPNLVHYPYFNPFFITLPLIKSFPTVVTVHDLIPLVSPEHFPPGIKGHVRWLIQKWSLKRVLGVIADSQATKRDIVRLAGLSEEKIYVVYLAAQDIFKPAKGTLLIDSIRVKYNLPERFVLYVGDVLWSKNVPNLIQAIKTINLTLVMVGKQAAATDFDKNNPWNKDLIILNEEARNDKRIIRLGFVPDNELVTIYNAATVLVQPSFYEGFGLPVLEAMNCGCPVVTTRGGSLPEVTGNAAFYVNPYDVSSIANGIGEVFFNKKLQDELSQKGLTQAKNFSWKETARETVKVYRRVLSIKY